MTKEQKIIRGKLGLLELARQLGNVSQACKLAGYSRDSFYRFRRFYDTGGELALEEISRAKPVLKNRVDPAVEATVLALTLAFPTYGRVRIAREMHARALTISPAGVRSVWERHDLQTRRQRLKMLAVSAAQDGRRLTDVQRAALATADRGPRDAFGSEYPGSCGAQDSYRVGVLKGVGRVYQQTFVDTYSKLAFAKVYDRRTPDTATDLLETRVLPFFAAQGVRLRRILTDRGTEYFGHPEPNDYASCLAAANIDHGCTRAARPQTHGLVARLHETLLNEFYRLATRTTVYPSLDALQVDLDAWLEAYNVDRPHPGRWCFGKTPLQTFIASKNIALAKSPRAA